LSFYEKSRKTRNKNLHVSKNEKFFIISWWGKLNLMKIYLDYDLKMGLFDKFGKKIENSIKNTFDSTKNLHK